MIQIAAAIFFLGALIAPLAIVALMLSQNWRAIVTALRGGSSIEPMPENRPARIRTMRSASYRPVSKRPRAARVAA